MSKIQFPATGELKLQDNLKYGKYELVQALLPAKQVDETASETDAIFIGILLDGVKYPYEVLFGEYESLPGVFASIQTADLEEANAWFEAIETYRS
jgi:hypothetical protein